MAMIIKRFHLRPDQIDILEQVRENTGASMAFTIRRAIDKYLGIKKRTPQRASGRISRGRCKG